ncbi:MULTISPECIES: hypothetical protein [unclassified Aminobacter]|uniref:hypothetical protein n=1 Tax=unclassified Aminobacter TaxID=2644704 RepID=UPI000463B45E|nr:MULTISPECIES: hypothetical protein [unclassified Aminobacter]
MKQDAASATPPTSWETFLVEVLREEVASREAELDALRASLRYRVGSWALEAFPPGWGTVIFFSRLLRLFLRRRTQKPSGAISGRHRGQSEAQHHANIVVFGRNVPACYAKDDVWQTKNADLIAHRLDMKGSVPGILVVRQVSEKILRRVERARRDHWHVIWYPEETSSTFDPALVAYILAHADEVRIDKGISS